jgi:hypothetical protein
LCRQRLQEHNDALEREKQREKWDLAQ